MFYFYTKKIQRFFVVNSALKHLEVGVCLRYPKSEVLVFKLCKMAFPSQEGNKPDFWKD